MTAASFARVSWFGGDLDEVTGYTGAGMVTVLTSHRSPAGELVVSPALASTADVIVSAAPIPPRRRPRRTVRTPAGDQFLLFDTAS
ncbi:hypothetical protein SEA_SAMPSON_4 [Gordonia Phage Sampson]|uniref:Uncharacterized protein n=3 Tax=Zitchvirus TaxID=2948963 RepID=A0A976U9M9_9CAUD|nr:hypothetical protein SEA_SAMPSON_4 [Gordonia Phage Sampson]UVF61625.1 hypothetical protein SEA_APUNK_4 [Gordonia phage APunk]UVG34967.1 hypothetical protein SEA_VIACONLECTUS_4 [Gordonia phage ViaConlectus]